MMPTPPPSRRPFHFQAAWLLHPDFGSVIRNAWLPHRDSVVDAIKSVQTASKDFNVNVFGNIFRRKKKTSRLMGSRNI